MIAIASSHSQALLVLLQNIMLFLECGLCGVTSFSDYYMK